MSNSENPPIGHDGAMKEMEHIKPCNTFDLVRPVPDGYEMDVDSSTILAVDRNGVKPTVYFSFAKRTRGWHQYPTYGAPANARAVPAPSPSNK